MSAGNRYQPEEERVEYVTFGHDGRGETEDRPGEWQTCGAYYAAMATLDDELPSVESDPVSPSHYKGFSNGAEVIDITENLTGNGAAAVKYLARATRIDGHNKGKIIEDLRKSLWYTRRELARMGVEDA